MIASRTTPDNEEGSPHPASHSTPGETSLSPSPTRRRCDDVPMTSTIREDLNYDEITLPRRGVHKQLKRGDIIFGKLQYSAVENSPQMKNCSEKRDDDDDEFSRKQREMGTRLDKQIEGRVEMDLLSSPSFPSSSPFSSSPSLSSLSQTESYNTSLEVNTEESCEKENGTARRRSKRRRKERVYYGEQEEEESEKLGRNQKRMDGEENEERKEKEVKQNGTRGRGGNGKSRKSRLNESKEKKIERDSRREKNGTTIENIDEEKQQQLVQDFKELLGDVYTRHGYCIAICTEVKQNFEPN